MMDQPTSQQRTGRQDERSGFTDGIKRRLTSLRWLARVAGVGLSSVSIGFVVLFVFVLETDGDLALITRPLPMQVALALPYLIGGLTLVATAGALVGWRYRYWSLRARIHQTVLALLGHAFCWQLAALGFITV